MAHKGGQGVHLDQEREEACGPDRTKGFTMWLLLIILLTPPPGLSGATVLNSFTTYEECQPERNRIGFEMAESYPHENDFRIVCEFHENEISHSHRVPIHDIH